MAGRDEGEMKRTRRSNDGAMTRPSVLFVSVRLFGDRPSV